jgi:hypothetical protein
VSAEAAEKLRMQVIDALDRLPDTADGIADYFTEVGIKGRQHMPWACPLARYVAIECGVDAKWRRISVIERVAITATDMTVVVPLPEHARRFENDFDSNLYPHLIEGAQ